MQALAACVKRVFSFSGSPKMKQLNDGHCVNRQRFSCHMIFAQRKMTDEIEEPRLKIRSEAGVK